MRTLYELEVDIAAVRPAGPATQSAAAPPRPAGAPASTAVAPPPPVHALTARQGAAARLQALPPAVVPSHHVNDSADSLDESIKSIHALAEMERASALAAGGDDLKKRVMTKVQSSTASYQSDVISHCLPEV